MKKPASPKYSGNDFREDLERFYGMSLDPEQKAFRDAICRSGGIITFCNAIAGSGKTTIAVGCANLLCRYGIVNGIVSVVSPTQEQVQGYLKGSIEEKSAPYMGALEEALLEIGINPSQVISTPDNMKAVKEGLAYVTAITHTFLRGKNVSKKAIIIDEAQNFYLSDLKKTLTRPHDDCKVIVIGHTGQIDLYKHPENSGFAPMIEHFRSKHDERAAFCELHHNYRGWVSTTADEVLTEIERDTR